MNNYNEGNNNSNDEIINYSNNIPTIAIETAFKNLDAVREDNDVNNSNSNPNDNNNNNILEDRPIFFTPNHRAAKLTPGQNFDKGVDYLGAPAVKGIVEKKNENDKTDVYIRVVLSKVTEIDVIESSFSAEFYVQSRWREAKLDQQNKINKTAIKWDDFWNPRLQIENVDGAITGKKRKTIEALKRGKNWKNFEDPIKEKQWKTVEFSGENEAFIYERRKIKGRFQADMKLKYFPFDMQKIFLTVGSERSEDEVRLLADCSHKMPPFAVGCSPDAVYWRFKEKRRRNRYLRWLYRDDYDCEYDFYSNNNDNNTVNVNKVYSNDDVDEFDDDDDDEFSKAEKASAGPLATAKTDSDNKTELEYLKIRVDIEEDESQKSLAFVCYLERKPNFFLYNIFLVLVRVLKKK
ncbi:hypothetical protein HELRODRAFT_172062 [Helobdella robusta]|uniref:Uncharacterized protein n=1 Tax=Helobdella robusta TaxID=6412 RepID=T1F4Z6_HELRO|nr:hypothetical protein HELRODRAFT_172062 [Helobdella robusta]ESO05048.1 hypothetical protein HELRODRAFT_172062 [Helobdella robusta]